jgi:hypothetical protein
MPHVDLVRLVMDVEHRLDVDLESVPSAGPFTLGDLHTIVVRALQNDMLDEREADRRSWATLLAGIARQGVALDEISPHLMLLGYRV